MKKILLATHLTLAEAILDSLRFIVGEQESIEALCAYTPDTPDLEAAVKTYMDTLQPEDEVIIVTDVYGGSVNNEFMKYINHPGIHLIAGLSLPLLMELIVGMNMDTSEQIKIALENGGKAIDCRKLWIEMQDAREADAAEEGI